MTDFTNNSQNEIPIRLAADIRLRREYFGALVYDTRNGNILEVDKETFHFLDLIKDKPLRIYDAINFLVQNRIIRNSHRSIDATLRKLFELNIIEKRYESLSVPVLKDQRSVKHNKPWLSAPETVHWAVPIAVKKIVQTVTPDDSLVQKPSSVRQRRCNSLIQLQTGGCFSWQSEEVNPLPDRICHDLFIMLINEGYQSISQQANWN